MRGALGILGVVIVGAIGLSMYRTAMVGSGGRGTENPRATVDIIGVKTDLTAMGRAERDFMGLNGRYASLDELANGHLSFDPARGRSGYTYSAVLTRDGFTITATYSGPASGVAASRSPRTPPCRGAGLLRPAYVPAHARTRSPPKRRGPPLSHRVVAAQLTRSRPPACARQAPRSCRCAELE